MARSETEYAHLARSIDDLVDVVFASSRALVAVSARSIATAHGVTLPQYRMLVVLDHGPTNLTSLAEALDVAPSTAMRMIDRLVISGLVERTTPTSNRRETRLSLTATGHQTVRSVTDRRTRDLRAVVERIPVELHDQVAVGMAAFAAAAELAWPLPPTV